MEKRQNGPDLEIVTYNTAVDSAHPRRPQNSHFHDCHLSDDLLFYFISSFPSATVQTARSVKEPKRATPDGPPKSRNRQKTHGIQILQPDGSKVLGFVITYAVRRSRFLGGLPFYSQPLTVTIGTACNQPGRERAWVDKRGLYSVQGSPQHVFFLCILTFRILVPVLVVGGALSFSFFLSFCRFQGF